MAEESKQPIPAFHQRFSTPVSLEQAQERFINRINNGIQEHFEEIQRPYRSSAWKEVSLQYIASMLGTDELGARQALRPYIKRGLVQEITQ